MGLDMPLAFWHSGWNAKATIIHLILFFSFLILNIMAKIIDLGFYDCDDTPDFTPHNILKDRMADIFKDVPMSIKIIAKELVTVDGWKIYSVSQRRGRCYYQSKTITIPVWAMDDKRVGYKTWYISHEIAHTFARGDNHGQKFMKELKRICPQEYVHYELGYKPRNASIAGITQPSEPSDLLNLGF
jgi:hypothetical protein